MSQRLNRRRILKAAGASLALPFMPSLLSSKARAAMPIEPKRLLVYTVANGLNVARTDPDNPDPEGVLQPLADEISNRYTITTGLRMTAVSSSEDHEYTLPGLLTDVRVTNQSRFSFPLACGISCDQVAAQQIGTDTPFPSMQLAVPTPFEPISPNGDIYSTRMSWSSATTPLPAIESPRQLFDQMFAGVDAGATLEEIERRRRLKRSILDTVLDGVSSVQSKLNPSDRNKLEEYTQSVRDLETRLDQLEENTCPIPEAPNATLDLQFGTAAFVDLMVLALQCDYTRVITFLSSPTSGQATYPFLGINSGHHTLSHVSANNAQLMQIQRWHAGVFAGLGARLAEIEAGNDGEDLLSQTLLVLNSEFTNPWSHSAWPVPFILAGGEAGGVQQGEGRLLHFPAGTPHSNLMRAMIAFTGADPGDFGPNSTGTADLS